MGTMNGSNYIPGDFGLNLGDVLFLLLDCLVVLTILILFVVRKRDDEFLKVVLEI